MGLALVAGLVGGILGSKLMPASLPSEAQFTKVTVSDSIQLADAENKKTCTITGSELKLTETVQPQPASETASPEDATADGETPVATTEQPQQEPTERILCRITNGSLAVTSNVIAATVQGRVLLGENVRGNLVLGQTLAATANPNAALGDQQIYAQLAAVPNRGGILIVRDPKGVHIPKNGQVKTGQEMLFGFTGPGDPAAYLRDVDSNTRALFQTLVPTQVASREGAPTGTQNPPSTPSGPSGAGMPERPAAPAPGPSTGAPLPPLGGPAAGSPNRPAPPLSPPVSPYATGRPGSP